MSISKPNISLTLPRMRVMKGGSWGVGPPWHTCVISPRGRSPPMWLRIAEGKWKQQEAALGNVKRGAWNPTGQHWILHWKMSEGVISRTVGRFGGIPSQVFSVEQVVMVSGVSGCSGFYDYSWRTIPGWRRIVQPPANGAEEGATAAAMWARMC